ncbi:RusA family crossover junction endodeoxyribonuclease [Pediococcus acidilactici]|uniref:RusA family crossover junction endodeoxyribonuclease n=1 Tax=Pediococcus acidilactici TaxID=1254 RepID=UPI0013E8E522|nr:RusA family crossover junction endodeoxyribonuclease [Pediococcus acidilactici]MCK2074552.1 RusA family crossover junction endodeoxyribonuclease [Pediococcus acidilactici]
MIKLIIDGEPVAASRPRVTRKGWAYIAPKYKAYKDRTHLIVRNQYKGEPLMGALKVKTTFYRSVQKSVSKAERNRRLSNEHRPIFKPDIDNLFKAVTDACTGVVWHDDNQIVSVEMDKMYAEEPRVEMEVEEL